MWEGEGEGEQLQWYVEVLGAGQVPSATCGGAWPARLAHWHARDAIRSCRSAGTAGTVAGTLADLQLRVVPKTHDGGGEADLDREGCGGTGRHP